MEGPGALLAIGPGLWCLQPAVWASTPFPAKDDGSIALGFMVSLEGRQAGHFTWDSAPFPQCKWRDVQTGRCNTTEIAGPLPAPAPPLAVCWLIMDLYILDLVFPPLLQVHGNGGLH